MQKCGTKFKLLIINAQKSYQEVSKETDIPIDTLRKYANGERNIEKCTLVTAYRLAACLGVTMEELLFSAESLSGDFVGVKSSYVRKLAEGLVIGIRENEEWFDDIFSMRPNQKVALKVFHENFDREYTFRNIEYSADKTVFVFTDLADNEIRAKLILAPWYYPVETIIFRKDSNKYIMVIEGAEDEETN